jgi:hypothetical protein
MAAEQCRQKPSQRKRQKAERAAEFKRYIEVKRHTHNVSVKAFDIARAVNSVIVTQVIWLYDCIVQLQCIPVIS